MNSLRFVLAIALASTMPALQAETEFEDSIPLELAEIFLGLTVADGGVYADIVDGFPTIDLPATVTVLGSLDRQFSQTVYLRTDMEADAARTLVADLYAASGWLRIPSPYGAAGAQAVGFTGNIVMDPSFSALLCDDELGNLQINADEISGFTLITLIRQQTRNSSSQNCTQMLQARRPTNQPMIGIRNSLQTQLPRLELPTEAVLNGRRSGRTGNISGSRDEVEATTELQAALSLDAVHAHFASQIDGQGWAQDSNWTGNLVAGSTWSRNAEDERLLVGIFTVVQRQDDQYALKFRMLVR